MGKCFRQADIPFSIYEREDDFGGNWYAGKLSSKMYSSAHLISSKTNTQFSDFPMPNDYPWYPNHKLMLEYLRSIAKNFNLYEHTKFNTTVKKIEPVDPSLTKTTWRIILSDESEHIYNGVVIANGLLREPRWPKYPGNFNGLIMHANEYTSPDIFKNKRVLVVGGGNSGCDIAVDAASRAEKTFHSMRRGYHYMPKFIAGIPVQNWLMELAQQFNDKQSYWQYVKKIFKLTGFDGVDYGLPEPDHEIYQSHPILNSQILYFIGHGDVSPKDDIKELRESSVVFKDNSVEQVDLILYATGYDISLPFLDDEYLNWQDNYPDIYCYIFHKYYDNLFFSGYFNSPSGLGNLVNSGGSMLSAYIKALEKDTKAIKIFRKLKLAEEPDLGNSMFYQSPRHKYEVDLWSVVKLMNELRVKFLEST